MSYSFFFLLGIPLWLIPAAYMLRHETASPREKSAWAAMSFLSPFLLFGLGAIGTMLMQPQAEAAGASVRAFGYFIVLLNIVAFFLPFALQALFRSRQLTRRYSPPAAHSSR